MRVAAVDFGWFMVGGFTSFIVTANLCWRLWMRGRD